MEQDLPLFARWPDGWIISPYLSAKWEEFNEWQKEKSRNIKAAEREMASNLYNWAHETVPQNLTSLGRKLPQRTDYLSIVSPQWDMWEVYTFNPVIEKVNETNLDAFRKRQLNASPSIPNVEEGIGWTIAPATKEQIMQNRISQAKSRIVWVLDSMLKWWQMSTKAGADLARNLIDLYKKLK